jgi:hypothetical protein
LPGICDIMIILHTQYTTLGPIRQSPAGVRFRGHLLTCIPQLVYQRSIHFTVQGYERADFAVVHQLGSLDCRIKLSSALPFPSQINSHTIYRMTTIRRYGSLNNCMSAKRAT